MNGDEVKACFKASADFASSLTEETECFLVFRKDDEGLMYYSNGDPYTIIGILESISHSYKQALLHSESDE